MTDAVHPAETEPEGDAGATDPTAAAARRSASPPFAAGLAIGSAFLLLAALVGPAGLTGANPSRVAIAAVLAINALGWWAMCKDVEHRRMTWVVLVGSAWILFGWRAVESLMNQHRHGFPSLRSSALVVASVAGIAAAAFRRRGDRAVRAAVPVLRSAAAVGLFVPLGALGLSSIGMHRLANDSVLDRSTANGSESAAAPERVSAVAWSTELPSAAVEVFAGGMGAVVHLEDRVVALDGSTGEIRWHYRRDGAEIRELSVSPDGRSVLIQFDVGHHDVLVGLDAATGEHRFTNRLDESDTSVSVSRVDLAVSNDSFDRQLRTRSGRCTAYSLTTGDEVWTAELPSECDVADVNTDPVPSGFVVVCNPSDTDIERTAQFVLLDGATGEVNWRHDEQGARAFDSAQIAPDGSIARLVFSFDDGAGRIEAIEARLVDTVTGVVYETEVAGFWFELGYDRQVLTGDAQGFTIADLETGARHVGAPPSEDVIDGSNRVTYPTAPDPIPGGFV